MTNKISDDAAFDIMLNEDFRERYFFLRWLEVHISEKDRLRIIKLEEDIHALEEKGSFVVIRTEQAALTRKVNSKIEKIETIRDKYMPLWIKSYDKYKYTLGYHDTKITTTLKEKENERTNRVRTI